MKLSDLKDKTWIYRGRQIRVNDVALVDGQVELSTATGIIRIDRSKFDPEEFLPVEETRAVALPEDAGRMQTLEDILMESIDKVRQDPSYISQAKQISNAANTLVNITKTKIMIMRGR